MEIALQIAMLLFTVLYSFYLIDCKKVAFIYGVIGSIITAIKFMLSGVYVQGTLFIMYAIFYVYTFLKWKNNIQDELPVKINKNQVINSCVFIAIFTILFSYIMKGSQMPVLDAFTASLSLVGAFWLNRKVIENSFFLCAANICSIYICLLTGDYIAILTFTVYFVFNIWRVIGWNRIRKGRTKDE